MAVVFGLFTVLLVLGLSGELGHSLRGIRLSDPPSGPAPSALPRVAVAAGVTAGVQLASLYWQLTNADLRRLAAVALIAVAFALSVRVPSPSYLAFVAMPATVAVGVLGIVRLRERRESMLRTQSHSRLWATIFLASGWAVVALTLL